MRIILENGVEIQVPKEIAQTVMDTIFTADVGDHPVDVSVPPPAARKSGKNAVVESDNQDIDFVGRRTFTDAERTNIIEMRKRGFSVKEIAKKMHCKRAKMDQFIYNLKKKGLLNSSQREAENNLEGL